MSRFVNNILNTIFPGRPAYKTLIRNKKSFLYQEGWMESKKLNYPCRADGTDLPWMNYSIISFLEERLKKNHSLFEFGSGYSTQFYSKYVKSVTSVEHEKEWFNLVSKKLPPNVKLIFTENDVDGNYCQSISKTNEKYDVIVVDGKDRVNCVKQSINSLSDSGVLLLDDSNREEYKEAFDFLIQKGFRTLQFKGLKPGGNGGIDYSTLFYRSDNCFSI